MRRFLYLTLCALSLFVTVTTAESCSNDQLEDLPIWVDSSKSNLYSVKSLFGEWQGEHCIWTQYKDGELIFEDDGPCQEYMSKIVFEKDGTGVIGDSNSPFTWMYLHNCIIVYRPLSKLDQCLEVLELTDDKLVLLSEGIPVGIPFVPYWKDKSGQHAIRTYEYKRQ